MSYARARNRSFKSIRSYRARRAANAIDIARKLGIAAMEKVFHGLINPDHRKDFRGLTVQDKKYVRRYYRLAVAEEKQLKTFRKTILSSSKSDDEKEALINSFMRVPANDLLGIRKLSDDDKLSKLDALVSESLSKSKGNGCDHNKERFIDDIAHLSPYDTRQSSDFYGSPLRNDNRKHGKRRKEIIYQLIDRLIFAATIPDKNYSIFFKKTDNKVASRGDWYRLIRSEGREGMIKVMIFMLLYTDIKSLRVGVPTNYDKTEYSGISIANIAKHTGLSESRVRTAIRNLEDTGFLNATCLYKDKLDDNGKPVVNDKTGKVVKILVKTTQYREKKADGSWFGLAVVRTWTKKLFESVALDERGANERAKSRFQDKPVKKQGKSFKDAVSENAHISSASDLLSDLQSIAAA